MPKKKILFIVHHRLQRSPGQRFRFEQYLDALREDGFEVEISNILSEKDDRIFYSSGNYWGKFRIMIQSFFHRMADVQRCKQVDVVFVYREAFMLGTILFEGLFAQSSAKLVFDFDDSIWINDTSEGNKNLSWLKNPDKTRSIIKLADTVIVGNEYLADYARQFNPRTVVIPTTIDTSYHKPLHEKMATETVCIGWTGTSTTLRHFIAIEPVLIRLKTKYGDRLRFKLINNAQYHNDALCLETTPWTLSREIEDLMDIDIGIMPLPDDQWAKGKCGFKGLQYMALEIPTVMSPVGVNTNIIQHGANGFLASSEDEWFQVLTQLIDSAELRHLIGKNGRQTIIDTYSVESYKQRYVSLFNSLIDKYFTLNWCRLTRSYEYSSFTKNLLSKRPASV